MTTHLGQTILFYPGTNNKELGFDPRPAMVTVAWSQDCVNLELITGTERGLQFSSVPYEVNPDSREGFCWHEKGVLDIP